MCNLLKIFYIYSKLFPAFFPICDYHFSPTRDSHFKVTLKGFSEWYQSQTGLQAVNGQTSAEDLIFVYPILRLVLSSICGTS